MTYKEYAELAQRTASTKTKEDKIGHGCLGLIGESGEIVDIVKKMKYMGMTDEIAKDKLIDECGDFLWYLVEFCYGLDFDFAQLIEQTYKYCHLFSDDLEDIAVELTGSITDMHYACYPDRWAKIDSADMLDLMNIFLEFVRLVKLDIEEIKRHNIDKLSKRYPDHVFSSERSNDRYQ